MDLDWLNDFRALADQGNFSRAADKRNVTQPAFSRRIRALEDWFGTALFIRSTQGATLTPAGELLQPIADELLRTLDRARRETQAVSERQNLSLSFAATHALSFTFFPSWIRRHASLDELNTVSLISNSMAACENSILSGEVHFLLCHYHADAPTQFDPECMQSIRLGGDTLVAVSAPDSQGQPTWPIPSKDTAVSRVLGYRQSSGLGRIIAAHQDRATGTAGVETVFTSHLAATLMTMAREGQGAAWLPLTLAGEDLASGRLVRASSDDHDIPIDIRLFRSSDCRNQAADRLWSSLTTQSDRVP